MAQLDNLRKKCEVLGIEPEKSRNRVNHETGERYKESTIDDCIKALQNYYINKYKAEGTLNPFVENILNHKPMLAAQMKGIKEDVQRNLWMDNNEWYATEKIDGNRMRYCYNESYGVEYFSRNLSEGVEGDYLPLRYSDRLTIPKPDRIELMSKDIHSFIIDCELVPFYDNIRQFTNVRKVNGQWVEVLEYPVADTGLSLTTSVLGALPELSHRIQETNPMKLMAFDIIELNGKDLSDEPLLKRLQILAEIVAKVRLAGVGDKIQLVRGARSNKTKFYQDIISRGGEGCVIKDLTSVYVGKREKTWVKAKRSVTGSLLEENMGDNIDAFIIGYKPGNKGTNIENYIGALDFGIYLLDDEGNYIVDDRGMPVIHHIATVSGLTLEERQAMTDYDNEGNPKLKIAYYNKVAEIDGQDVSSKNYRLSHSLIKRWRPDKNADDCLIKKSFLESLVL